MHNYNKNCNSCVNQHIAFFIRLIPLSLQPKTNLYDMFIQSCPNCMSLLKLFKFQFTIIYNKNILPYLSIKFIPQFSGSTEQLPPPHTITNIRFLLQQPPPLYYTFIYWDVCITTCSIHKQKSNSSKAITSNQ